jgi:hypothetical protein
MEDNTLTNPKSRQMSLQSLGGHPGWPVYCARFSEIIQKQIEAKIFDTKTPDDERRTLVAARKMLTEAYTPDKMRESMIAQATTEVMRLENPGGK